MSNCIRSFVHDPIHYHWLDETFLRDLVILNVSELPLNVMFRMFKSPITPWCIIICESVNDWIILFDINNVFCEFQMNSGRSFQFNLSDIEKMKKIKRYLACKCYVQFHHPTYSILCFRTYAEKFYRKILGASETNVSEVTL